MKGLLFLNGDPPDENALRAIDYACLTACADGAYNYLKDCCVPDVLVGDFDSLNISNGQINAKKIKRLDTEKDFTDGHIALLELIDTGADFIEIYGAFGGRPDHELSNYSLLLLAANHNVKAVIRGERFDIYYASSQFCADFRAPANHGKIVSLVPFCDTVHILSSQGLKYAIKNEKFNKLHIKGISNIALGEEIGFLIKSGCALVFIEN